MKAVFEQDLDRAHAVAPADLLALRAAARLEADRQLENRMAGAQQLRGDLGLDVEAVRFEIERLRDVARHHLVAGLHVGEPAAKQHVGDAGQHLVGDDRQPRRVRTAGEEARAIDDARAAIEDRLRQLRQLRRIELEVGVLDRDDGAGRLRESDPDGAALPAVLLGVNDAQLGPLRRSWSSTSRVPSVEPSLTTRISRGAGRSIAISRSMTSATVRASL